MNGSEYNEAAKHTNAGDTSFNQPLVLNASFHAERMRAAVEIVKALATAPVVMNDMTVPTQSLYEAACRFLTRELSCS